LKRARNLRGIFEELRGKRSNLARIGEKWRQKAVATQQVINIIANFASRNKPTQYVKYTRQYNRFREHIRSYYYAAYDVHPHSRGYVQPQQADEGTH
jgi:hypothetical protein